MKAVLVPALVAASLLLTACNKEDVPSDKLTSETIMKVAERDTMEGLKVADFRRDNGWQDTESPNRYIVRYAYNLELTQPLPEVVLAAAKDLMVEVSKAEANPGFMGINLTNQVLSLAMNASDWTRSQGDAFVARRDAFLKDCAPCLEYWNTSQGPSVSKELIDTHRHAYLVAWKHVEDLGFADSANVGDRVGRTAWAAFMKTEKGWAAIE